ncbi:collagen binding domain-containing protein [Lysinibacillus sp. NPDC048646]|uniref:collagen binding domain-containing protein n=1 Tax=Lysinibacillus sp. NPDC048646 TaxID=3390574 RepID=UPI003D00D68E
MKKLNLAIITLLLVFQTVLSPISVFAEEDLSTPPVENDNGTDLTEADTDEEDLSTPPVENGNSTDLTEGGSGEEDLSTTQPENESTEQAPEGDIGENVDEASEEEETATDDSEKTVPLNVEPLAIDLVVDRNDANFKEEIVLTIDNTPVTGTSAEGKVGDTIKFRVDLALEPGHTYGEDSRLTYELPAQFTGLTGNKQLFYNGKVIGNVEVSGQIVSIRFTDAIRDEAGAGTVVEDVFFEITGTLQSANNSWSETIQVPGFQDITLNFTPASNGSAITKSGVADNGAKNSEYITWTVDVNTNLAANTDGGTTTFIDTLTGAHTFDVIESITELNISPNGAITEGDSVTPLPTISGTTMTIELLNKAHTGYRIVYKTKVNDLGIIPPAKFYNKASYNGTTINKEIPVGFDTPLEKSVSSPTVESSGVVTTEWTIKYNHNKRTIPAGSATLSDVWTAGHELFGAVKVYKNGSSTPEASGYTVTPKANGLGFDLAFPGGVTDAYTIKYKTKPDANTYPTTDRSITNTVTRGDFTNHNGLTNQAAITYYKKDLILNKTAKGVNYEAKTMDWKIVANQAKYTLAEGTKLTDTYEGSYLTLKDGLTVTAGAATLKEGTHYTLTNTTGTVDGQTRETGFVIELLQPVSDQIVIEYTTDYEIKDTGTNTRGYKNQVTLSDTGIPNFETSTASTTQEIKNEQKANGKKTGSYNYETKTFHWDVELNFNYNQIDNAVFKDTLPPSQKVTELKVVKGTLSAGGNFVPSTDPSDTQIVDVTNITNEIVLELGTIKTPYKVTYQSKDADAVYPHGSAITISNVAKLFSQGNENSPNATWHADVPVAHTEKIIDKKGTSTSSSPQVNWNFKFNYAQSQLSNIVITDTVGKIDDDPAQLILKDSFKVWEMNFTGTNSTPAKGQPVTLTDENLIVDIVAGTFELKLPDGDKAYYVEYSTVFMGPNGSKVDNVVNVSYLSEEGNSGSSTVNDLVFKYDAGGKVGTVPFVILKTDAATGLPMDNVKFDLYGPYTGNTLLTSGSTNTEGYLNYGLKLAPSANATKKYKVVEETQTGYKPLTQEFELNLDKIETSGKYKGFQVIEIENEPESGLKCTQFELTVYDIDGKVINGGTVTLVSKATGLSENHSIAGNGKVTFTPDQVKAGQYDVVYDGVTLKTIIVEYNDKCNENVQPAPKCENFTIVVEDTEGNIRTNIKELTLKSGATEVKVSHVTAGKFIFESNKNNSINGVEPGEYTVYEGNQFLGTVTLTYAEDCGHEFIVKQAPKCENFELTVKDVDGNNITDGTSTIVVKDAGGNEIINTTTTTGVIELTDLEPSTYTVEVDGEEIGNFQNNIECKVTVQPAPSCPQFTLTVKDENGNLRSNVGNITIKDKTGAIIVTNKTTNELGQINIPSTDIPSGEYNVYQGELFIGQITVQYSVNCEAEVVAAPTCPSFTLTVQTEFGTPLTNAKITIKDAASNRIKDVDNNEILTTSVAGTILLPNKAIKQGTYYVYEGSRLIGSFTVKDTCSALVKPTSTGGGGGGWTPDPEKPVDPSKPTPDPEKPVDPSKPTPDPEKPVDPSKPTPDPEKPVDPGKPTPDPEKPVDPGNPSTNPEESVDPENPTPDSGKPTTPGKPETSKPSVQDVIDQGKNLTPYNPSMATKDTLDEYKDFLNKYNNLSKEEQAVVAQSLDIDKIKAAAKQLEAQLNTKGKLPQTDGANQTVLTLIGLILVIGAVFFLRRRSADMK